MLLLASPVVENKKKKLKESFSFIKNKIQRPVKMGIILVGDSPASLKYIQHKKKFLNSLEVECDIFHFPSTLSQDSFETHLKTIAHNPLIDGLLVQLPIPPSLHLLNFSSLVPFYKDVDGFHSTNIANLYYNLPNSLIPCTPKGILSLLDFYGHTFFQKSVVIMGRSFIVGRPMALLALNYGATVNILHSQTLSTTKESLLTQADILILATGVPKILTHQSLEKRSKSCVIVDVGINITQEGKIIGDSDVETLFNSPYVSAITPVPGGVGPMTIVSLAENLLLSRDLNTKINGLT